MLTPSEYQLEAISMAQKSNTFINSECGTGKTLMAIEAAKNLLPGPILIFCPRLAKEQWRQFIIDQEPSAQVYVLGKAGSLPDDFDWPMLVENRRVWVLAHYETLLKIGPQLAQVPWRLIIADEAHRFKNRRAKRTLWLKRIKSERRLALTGTLMEKHIDDVWSLLNWLDPKEFPSYWAFRGRYVDEEKHPYLGFPIIKGSKNLDELAGRLQGRYIRHTKEAVLQDLPPKRLARVLLDLAECPSQKALYDELAASNDIEVPLGTSINQLQPMVIASALAKLVRLQQLSSDPHLLNFLVPSTKLEWVQDYVDDNPEEPIIVFTKFRQTAIDLAALLQADLVVGGIKQLPVAWLSGKKNVLVGTIAAIGESLDLPRGRTSIFIDQEWSATKMNQAIDRIHRRGIKEPKNIIYLCNKGTVDELVLTALDKKWSEAEIAYRFLKGANS